MRVPNVVKVGGSFVTEGQIDVSTLPYKEPSGYVAVSGIISAGSVDDGDFADGGTLTVYGTADQTTVGASGYMVVHGAANGTVVQTSGLKVVFSGGVEIGATVAGNAQVYAGGNMSNMIVEAGGDLHVGLIGYGPGGVALDTLVESGGAEVINSGGVASHTAIATGGLEIVNSGGLERSASVSGNAQVYAGGALLSATLYSGGSLLVGLSGFGAGGTAIGTVVERGALEVVSSGGTDIGMSVIGNAQILSAALRRTPRSTAAARSLSSRAASRSARWCRPAASSS